MNLGTGICLVTQRDPIVLAKEVASLDRISGGRFQFGINAGWLKEEMEALGTKFETRWKVTEERIAAVKLAWTEEEPEYHGKFVDMPKTFVYPKPAQDPHPPILIGAASKWARQRVVDWGDAWMPNATDPGFVEYGFGDIRRRAEAAGRDPESIKSTVFGAIEEALDEYDRMGAERCIFRLPSAGHDEVIAELDRLTKLARLSG